MKYLVLLSLLFLAGCASTQLTKEQAEVRILRKSDPDRSCKELGKVRGKIMPMSDEDNENYIKLATYNMGGNTVTIDKIGGDFNLEGTAFKCN